MYKSHRIKKNESGTVSIQVEFSTKQLVEQVGKQGTLFGDTVSPFSGNIL